MVTHSPAPVKPILFACGLNLAYLAWRELVVRHKIRVIHAYAGDSRNLERTLRRNQEILGV
jgi:hypothetical protein